MSGTGRARIALAALLFIAAVGCAGTETIDTTATTAPKSVGAAARTYAGTVPDAGPTRLMKVDELRPLIAFGYDIREQPVFDPKTFNLATIRGACGASVNTPFTDLKHVKIYKSTVTLVIEAIADTTPDAAKTFVAQLEQDLHPGCPDHDERIGVGISKVTYDTNVAMPNVGDQRLGWTESIKGADGSLGYQTVMVVREGGRLTLLVVLATRAVDPTQYGELVRVASRVR